MECISKGNRICLLPTSSSGIAYRGNCDEWSRARAFIGSQRKRGGAGARLEESNELDFHCTTDGERVGQSGSA